MGTFFFEFLPDLGFNPDQQRADSSNLNTTVIAYLAHDSYMKQLFANEGNGFVVIKVSDFDKYPNARVSWLSVSKTWVNLVKNRPNLKDYYFVISEEVYNKLKANAPLGNTISFRLGKSQAGTIVAYLIYGTYNDFRGGGGTGLLHGAKVPPTP